MIAATQIVSGQLRGDVGSDLLRSAVFALRDLRLKPTRWRTQ